MLKSGSVNKCVAFLNNTNKTCQKTLLLILVLKEHIYKWAPITCEKYPKISGDPTALPF